MTAPAAIGAPAARLRRSLEYVPAADPATVAQARESRADVICLDLEDGVPASEKDRARQTVAHAVTAGGFAPRELVVRINGVGTEAHEADLAALRRLPVDGVVVPKVRGAATAAAVRTALNDRLPLWCMIECAEGLLDARAIAASGGVTALLVGGHDLAETLHIPGRHMARGLALHVAPVILAARAAGITAMAAVAFVEEPGDDVLGFDGRSCFRGQDIAAINRAFTPAASEVEAARKIIAGAQIYGEHLDHARALLAFAQAAAARDAA